MHTYVILRRNINIRQSSVRFDLISWWMKKQTPGDAERRAIRYSYKSSHTRRSHLLWIGLFTRRTTTTTMTLITLTFLILFFILIMDSSKGENHNETICLCAKWYIDSTRSSKPSSWAIFGFSLSLSLSLFYFFFIRANLPNKAGRKRLALSATGRAKVKSERWPEGAPRRLVLRANLLKFKEAGY